MQPGLYPKDVVLLLLGKIAVAASGLEVVLSVFFHPDGEAAAHYPALPDRCRKHAAKLRPEARSVAMALLDDAERLLNQRNRVIHAHAYLAGFGPGEPPELIVERRHIKSQTRGLDDPLTLAALCLGLESCHRRVFDVVLAIGDDLRALKGPQSGPLDP